MYDDSLQKDSILPVFGAIVILKDADLTLEFLLSLLTSVFRKSDIEANDIITDIYHNDESMVGIYAYDIAEYKMQLALSLARSLGESLRLELRRVS
ncbi:ATP-dependent Clp protease adaptor ClpS [Helicobacter sp. 11S02629-2]|uniref:ATP-dependent Clp protease adaptor ClpS n=1 Tax=Helicobacter sp. 11S02629-2 TaxID=1476195 RepID=UPI000BA56CD3|nr:ATP-dependent Clp protease adaptor ClpS [Helicobacter sp. 11S02629-2]PAF41617.1 hypothetical protein BKH40_08355 [Helicobacter sp. 11S02629-2]